MTGSERLAGWLSRRNLWAASLGVVFLLAVASASTAGGESDYERLSPAVRLGNAHQVTTSPAGVSCRTVAASLAVVGQQPEFRQEVANGTLIDAATAKWHSSVAGDYPVVLEASNVANRDVCWFGGTIIGDYPAGTSWETYHGTSAMKIRSPGVTVEGVTIDNYGDGIGFSEGTSSQWTIRDAKMTNIHDDCVENDYMHGGVVENSLLDGCYVAFSARGHSGQKSPPDGRAQTMIIRNNLVYVKPMRSVYKGTAPGNGAIFKWANLTGDEGYGTMLSLHDNIFRVDMDTEINFNGGMGTPSYRDPATGDLKSYVASCSNNVIVWTGQGPYPATVPACFTVTTDINIWNSAVDSWTRTR